MKLPSSHSIPFKLIYIAPIHKNSGLKVLYTIRKRHYNIREKTSIIRRSPVSKQTSLKEGQSSRVTGWEMRREKEHREEERQTMGERTKVNVSGVKKRSVEESASWQI